MGQCLLKPVVHGVCVGGSCGSAVLVEASGTWCVGVTWVSAVLIEASGTWCVCGEVTWVSAVLVEASGKWCLCVQASGTWCVCVLTPVARVVCSTGCWSHSPEGSGGGWCGAPSLRLVQETHHQIWLFG